MKKTNGWFKSAVALVSLAFGLAAQAAVCKIGTTEYPTLTAAVAEVKEGDVLTFLANSSENLDLTNCKVGFEIVFGSYQYTGTSTPAKGYGFTLYDSRFLYAKLPEADVSRTTDVSEMGEYDLYDLSSGLTQMGFKQKPQVEYVFEADLTEESNPYDNWVADFTVSIDGAVAKDSMGLVGEYGIMHIGFPVPEAIPANTKVPLLSFIGLGFTYAGIRNQVQVFTCGAFNYSTENVGKTMNVELRLFDPTVFDEPSKIMDITLWKEGINTHLITNITYTFDAALAIDMGDQGKFDSTSTAKSGEKIPAGMLYNNGGTIGVSDGSVEVNTDTAYFRPVRPVAGVTVIEDTSEFADNMFILDVSNASAGSLAGTMVDPEIKPNLQVGYEFAAVQSGTSPYDDWYADFAVSMDQAVAKDSMGLWGSYSGLAFGFFAPSAIPANYKIPLLNSMMASPYWTYENIRDYVKTFGCGAFNYSADNVGKKLNVELRIFDPGFFESPEAILDSSTWKEGYNTFLITNIVWTMDSAVPVELAENGRKFSCAGAGTTISAGKWHVSDCKFIEADSDVSVNVPTAYFVEGIPVAQVTIGGVTTKYADLHAALEAAKSAGAVCELLGDVVLTGNWTPVTGFQGTFDGKGHTISGLNVNAENGAALIAGTGTVEEDVLVIVKNVTIQSPSITGANYTGVVFGNGFRAMVSNVTVVAATVNGTKYVGGISGASYCDILDSTIINSEVTGVDQVGGMIGYICGSSIVGCVATNNAITASEERAGGLAGKLSVVGESYFNDNIVSGTATCTAEKAGGIAGQIMGTDDNEPPDLTIYVYYEIKNNTIDVALNGKEVCPVGVLRDGSLDSFKTNLAANVTGNTWTTQTYPENSYTYTYTTSASVAGEQTIWNGEPPAYVAQVVSGSKTTKYTDLHEALTACKASETVELLCNVDLKGEAWTPVNMAGSFDGKGFAISNLYINLPENGGVGFFSYFSGSKTLKNVDFVNVDVTGLHNVGAIVGSSCIGTIQDVTVTGTIKVEATGADGDGYCRAGVVVGGWAYGTYKNVMVDGGDKATSYVRGQKQKDIDGRYVSGMIGHADDVHLYENCTVKNLTIDGKWLGAGLAGAGPGNAVCTNCTVEGVVLTGPYSGALFGWLYNDDDQPAKIPVVADATIRDVTFTNQLECGTIGGCGPDLGVVVRNATIEEVAPLKYNYQVYVTDEGDNYHYANILTAVLNVENLEDITVTNDKIEVPIGYELYVKGDLWGVREVPIKVVRVGDVEYPSIDIALACSTGDVSMVLITNAVCGRIELSGAVNPQITNLTIDLNGFTLTDNGGDAFLTVDRLITIKDTVGTGFLNHTGTDDCVWLQGTKGGVVLESGKFKLGHTYGLAYASHSATTDMLVVKGGIYNVNPANDSKGRNYVAEGYEVVENPDPATAADFPYAVVQSTRTIVVTPETVQEALDNAKKGDTIVLTAGEYGVLYLRNNGSDANRIFEDVTIKVKAGDAVTVDQIAYQSVSGKSLDVENLTIDGITFDAPAKSAVLFNENVGYLRVNGLTVQYCTKVGDNSEGSLYDNAAFLGCYYDGATAIGATFNGDTSLTRGYHNISVLSNAITNVFQPIKFPNDGPLYGLTISGNTFTGCTDNHMMLSTKTTGTVVIENNEIVDMTGRFARISGAQDDAVFTITNNTVTAPRKYDTGGDGSIFKITGTSGFTVTEADNDWKPGEYSSGNATWIAMGDTSLIPVAEIVETGAKYSTLTGAVAAVKAGWTVKLLAASDTNITAGEVPFVLEKNGLAYTGTIAPASGFKTVASPIAGDDSVRYMPEDEDPVLTASYTKIASGFYQASASGHKDTTICLTSRAGLEFFRDVVNGEQAAATDYCAKIGWTSSVPQIYTERIFRGSTVRLLSDVDLDDDPWTPIGYHTLTVWEDSTKVTYPYTTASFDAGVYDANAHLTGNHIVSNLKIVGKGAAQSTKTEQAKIDSYYCGLFGYCSGMSTNSNLTVCNADVANGYDYCGVIAGDAHNNVFRNCQVVGTLSMTGCYRWTGVICGHGGGATFDACVVDVDGVLDGSTIASSYSFGGLTGNASGTLNISDCVVRGLTIKSQGTRVGGLVGDYGFGTISDCTVENVTIIADPGAANNRVGSIGGMRDDTAPTTDCTIISDSVIRNVSVMCAGTPIYTQWGACYAGVVDPIVGYDIVFDGDSKVIGGVFECCPDSRVAAGYVKVDLKTVNPSTFTVLKLYSVMFTADKGTAPDPTNYVLSATETMLPKPTNQPEGQTFNGWAFPGSELVANAIPAGTTGDLALTATWTDAQLITVKTNTTEVTPTVEIKVTKEWIDENVKKEKTTENIQEELNKEDPNGNLKWQNYVMGLASNASVIVDAPQNEDTKVISVVPNAVAPQADTGFTVKYSLDQVQTTGAPVVEGEPTTSDNLGIDLDAVESNAFFKVNVIVTKDGEDKGTKVAATNTLGVLKVESAAEKTIVAVPWEELGAGENSILVSNIVKTANLTPQGYYGEGEGEEYYDGDKLYVYDYTNATYSTWYLSPDLTWEPYGTEQADPTLARVSRGSAVWLERRDTSKPFYVYGQVSAKAAETKVEERVAENAPSWNLVAAPQVEPLDIDKTFVGELKEGAQIIVPTATAPKNYTYKDGHWGYPDLEVYTNTAGKVRSRTVRRTGDTLVPAGTGLWYLNKSETKKTINW